MSTRSKDSGGSTWQLLWGRGRLRCMKISKVVAVVGLVVAGMVPAGVASGVASGADVPGCTNAELVASYRDTGAGMSHRYGKLILTNVSDHACTTGGYGGLSYVGHGDGTQIGAAAQRTRSTVRTIVVRPGKRVVSVVDEISAAPYPKRRCRPVHVNGFRVYLPNETRSQYVEHPTTGCRNDHIHLIAHQAYRRP